MTASDRRLHTARGARVGPGALLASRAILCLIAHQSAPEPPPDTREIDGGGEMAGAGAWRNGEAVRWASRATPPPQDKLWGRHLRVVPRIADRHAHFVGVQISPNRFPQGYTSPNETGYIEASVFLIYPCARLLAPVRHIAKKTFPADQDCRLENYAAPTSAHRCRRGRTSEFCRRMLVGVLPYRRAADCVSHGYRRGRQCSGKWALAAARRR